MSEKQRNSNSGNPASSADDSGQLYSPTLAAAGASVDAIIASALNPMKKLGLNNADDFLKAAEQTGGQ